MTVVGPYRCWEASLLGVHFTGGVSMMLMGGVLTVLLSGTSVLALSSGIFSMTLPAFAPAFFFFLVILLGPASGALVFSSSLLLMLMLMLVADATATPVDGPVGERGEVDALLHVAAEAGWLGMVV